MQQSWGRLIFLWLVSATPALWRVRAVQAASSAPSSPNVTVDRECYPPGQGMVTVVVVVTVRANGTNTTTAMTTDNWVGLVSAASLEDDDLVVPEEDLVDWQVLGATTKTGNGAIVSSSVSLPNILPVGQYVAVLLRGPMATATPPYQGVASSQVFTVTNDCTMTNVGGSTTTTFDDGTTTTGLTGTTTSDNVRAALDLAAARDAIDTLLVQNIGLAPKILRLLFHDCLGGCDGCIDLTDPENLGLEGAIDALETVYEQHGDINGSGIISRADVWALAATVAVATVQSDHDAIDFPFDYWGRRDCDKREEVCLGRTGQPVPCEYKRGPHRNHPTMHIDTASLYHFFATEFDFTARETIVAMAGGHTIGSQSVQNSGINGPNGWVPNNRVFNKEYFDELIGGDSPDAAMDVLVNDAPAWRRTVEPAVGMFPDRPVWEGFPAANRRIIMLNADIALFRDLDEGNFDQSTGLVSCAFEDESAVAESVPACPHVQEAVLIGAELKHDNLQFKTEFRDVLEKMASTGYERVSCNLEVCKLVFVKKATTTYQKSTGTTYDYR